MMCKLLGVSVLICAIHVVYAKDPGVGDSCTQNGISGVCRLLSECAAARSRIGQRILSPCETNGVESVVCCIEPIVSEKSANRSTTTASIPTEAPIESQCDPLPTDQTPKKTGQKAWDKCIEYQQRLVYPCERRVALIGGYDRVDNCRHDAGPVIFGGAEANSCEFPHMVQLGLATSNGTRETALWDCSGTLLSDWFILTAGHCTSATRNGRYHTVSFAAIGSLLNLKRTVNDVDCQIYSIGNIIKHPEYAPPIRYHDIALLKTTTRITLSPSAVPACLDVFGGDRSTVIATGWGRTDNKNNEFPHSLQKVPLKQFNESVCRRYYHSNRNMRQGVNLTTQICYGHDTHICDTADGDSGSPLVIQNPLVACMYSAVGITSHGTKFGLPGVPGIYTRVSYYVPWIEGVVWPDDPSEARN